MVGQVVLGFLSDKWGRILVLKTSAKTLVCALVLSILISGLHIL